MNNSLQAIKQRFGIIGNSDQLNHALSTAMRVANTDLTVLITGESGVGKEIFSKIIHSLSARKHNKFIAVNCGAIPAGTINSELFGHEKGAFTGATNERKGYFETVDGGTIFLDEVGEMPLDTQSFLLRILESGEFLRVGSSKVLNTNVRVIAATNVELESRVRNGKFRDDLFYRLNTVPITVPSLRARREDIPLLFRKFTVDFAEQYRMDPVRLDDRAVLLLQNYNWPGNIRELKNFAEQVSVLAEKRELNADDLIQHLPKLGHRNLPMIPDRSANAENLHEREILYKLLFDMKGDLNDLKNLVFELIRRNDLRVPDMSHLKQLQGPDLTSPREEKNAALYEEEPEPDHSYKPILLDPRAPDFEKVEVVEENLSLEEMEKDLIQKALKKHSGRRKDASEDLGISERTLYRKIKQYDL